MQHPTPSADKEEETMMKYEKPMLEVVSFQEEEKLMLDAHDEAHGDLSLNGIIGYSLRTNSQSL
jgi:hypothetical protein